MLCKKDKVELLGYHANSYPFECGFRCPICRREWSDLQLSRAKWNCSEAEKAEVGADGIIFNR